MIEPLTARQRSAGLRRQFVNAGRAMVGVVQRCVPDTGSGQVLCYHLVGAGIGGVVDLSIAEFETHLETLTARGDVRSLADVISLRKGIALTFDDAFGNFAQEIWPRLRSAHLPATLFVPTGFIDGSHGSPLPLAPHLPPCTWRQLQEMHDQGLDIGSHSYAHQDMRGMSFDELQADVVTAKTRLQAMLGQDAAESFCFPRALVGQNVVQVILGHHRFALRGGGVSVGLLGGPVVRRSSVRADGLPLSRLLGRVIDVEELLADGYRHLRGWQVSSRDAAE